MYTLVSKIKIGKNSFDGVNDVKINRSIHTPGATATIKVPVTAVLKQKDETATAVETAKQIQVNDEVSIRLGYNETINEEFKGYVRKINYRTPLEIECEDEFFRQRQKPVTLSGTTTLKECLQKCGLNIRHAAELKLRNFNMDDKPVAKILEHLKTSYGLSVFFDLQGRVIASRTYDNEIKGPGAKYELRYNVISDDKLNYLQAKDVKLKVKATCFKKDGTEVKAEAGADGGITKSLYFYDVEDLVELKGQAEEELQKYSRDGYDGKITTFLLPYAEPCMTAILKDPTYPERDGEYYIESTETTFGLSGARREITIGKRM